MTERLTFCSTDGIFKVSPFNALGPSLSAMFAVRVAAYYVKWTGLIFATRLNIQHHLQKISDL